jgi:hypothetical protein
MSAVKKRSLTPSSTKKAKKARNASKSPARTVKGGDLVVVSTKPIAMYGIVAAILTANRGTTYRILMLCEINRGSSSYDGKLRDYKPRSVKFASNVGPSCVAALLGASKAFQNSHQSLILFINIMFNSAIQHFKAKHLYTQYANICPLFLAAIANYVPVAAAAPVVAVSYTLPVTTLPAVPLVKVSLLTEDDVHALDMSNAANIKLLKTELEKIRKSTVDVGQRKLTCKLKIESLKAEKAKSIMDMDMHKQQFIDIEIQISTLNERLDKEAKAIAQFNKNNIKFDTSIAASEQVLKDLVVEYTQDAPLRIAMQIQLISVANADADTSTDQIEDAVAKGTKQEMDYSGYAQLFNDERLAMPLHRTDDIENENEEPEVTIIPARTEWSFYSDQTTYMPFAAAQQILIEDGFSAYNVDKSKHIVTYISGPAGQAAYTYEVDFTTNEQLNVSTRRIRSVRRIVIPSNSVTSAKLAKNRWPADWIYMPEHAQQAFSQNMPVNRVAYNLDRVVPKYMPVTTFNTSFQLIPVPLDHPTYTKIESACFCHRTCIKITDIHQIQNPTQRSRYYANLKSMSHSNEDVEISPMYIESVSGCINDVMQSGPRPTDNYLGIGFRMDTLATLAIQGSTLNKNDYFIAGRGLVGRSEPGLYNKKSPSQIKGEDAGIFYNSTTDVGKTTYNLWSPDQVLYEYIVRFENI